MQMYTVKSKRAGGKWRVLRTALALEQAIDLVQDHIKQFNGEFSRATYTAWYMDVENNTRVLLAIDPVK